MYKKTVYILRKKSITLMRCYCTWGIRSACTCPWGVRRRWRGRGGTRTGTCAPGPDAPTPSRIRSPSESEFLCKLTSYKPLCRNSISIQIALNKIIEHIRHHIGFFLTYGVTHNNAAAKFIPFPENASGKARINLLTTVFPKAERRRWKLLM